MTEIKKASSAGFCFGVTRAVTLLEETLSADTKVCTLGEIIHNSVFTSRLRARGVKAISESEIPLLPADTAVLIRSHGVKKEISSLLEIIAKS